MNSKRREQQLERAIIQYEAERELSARALASVTASAIEAACFAKATPELRNDRQRAKFRRAEGEVYTRFYKTVRGDLLRKARRDLTGQIVAREARATR